MGVDDPGILYLTGTRTGLLELRMVEDALSAEELAEFSGYEFVSLAGCSLSEDGKKDSNWIEAEGGLPTYICEIARAIKRGGKTTSRAIAIAVGQVKNWAHGKGDVDADTRAKAAKALVQWTAMKVRAKAH